MILFMTDDHDDDIDDVISNDDDDNEDESFSVVTSLSLKGIYYHHCPNTRIKPTKINRF